MLYIDDNNTDSDSDNAIGTPQRAMQMYSLTCASASQRDVLCCNRDGEVCAHGIAWQPHGAINCDSNARQLSTSENVAQWFHAEASLRLGQPNVISPNPN